MSACTGELIASIQSAQLGPTNDKKIHIYIYLNKVLQEFNWECFLSREMDFYHHHHNHRYTYLSIFLSFFLFHSSYIYLEF